MAFFADTTTTTPASFTDRLTLWKDAFQAERQRRRVMRQTYNELASLSARELTDLGIDRSNLRSIAYEAAYGSKA